MAWVTALSPERRARRSLRWRIALTVAITTLLVILAQAMAFVELLEEEEEDLIDELLNRQIQLVLNSGDAGSLPAAMHFQRQSEAPADVRRLAIGNHEIFRDERELHVAVRESDGVRYALVFDVADHESRLRTLIGMTFAGAFGIALVTLLVVYVVSGQLTRDLRALADAVERQPADVALDLDVRGTAWSAEVAVVAEALERARARSRAALAREREVTANLSHELRTPLTAIRTDAELLGEYPDLPEPVRLRAAAITDQCDRIAALTSGVLTLAREMRARRVEPVRLQDAIANLAARLPEPSRLTLRVPEDTVVLADPALLDIVLGNLLTNAVQHGGGCIECTWGANTLEIADTGDGVPDSVLPHLFERGYRGAETGGHGLGLALAAAACAASGWCLSAANRPAGGLVVRLLFSGGTQAQAFSPKNHE